MTSVAAAQALNIAQIFAAEGIGKGRSNLAAGRCAGGGLISIREGTSGGIFVFCRQAVESANPGSFRG